MTALRPSVLAKRLLEQRMKWVECVNETENEIQVLRVADILADDKMSEWLFSAIAPDQETRAEIYGYGNNDIMREFEMIKAELLRLGRTGQSDANIILKAEPILECLIRGLHQEERDARQDIAPQNAEVKARIFKTLRKASAEREPITPNEIDAIQSEQMFIYQANRHARVVLEEILDTVRQIIQSFERGNPEQGHSPHSR